MRRTLARRETPGRTRADSINHVGSIVQYHTQHGILHGLLSDVLRDGRLLIIEMTRRDGNWISSMDAEHHVVRPEDMIAVVSKSR